MRRLLVIAGFSRCGTTWLHRRLTRHSRIRAALGHVKEIGYFEWAHRDALNAISGDQHWGDRILRSNAERFAGLEERCARLRERAGDDRQAAAQIARLRGFINDFGRDDDWYRGLFALRPDDWAIDSTPAYARLPGEAIRHMVNMAEEVRVLLVLREPAARLRSLMQHNRGELSRVLARDPRMAADLVPRRTSPYVEQIAAFAEVFGPDRLTTLFFEDLVRDGSGAVRSLLSSIGLDPEPAISEPMPVPNPSRPLTFDAAALRAMADHSEHAVAQVKAALGPVPPEWEAAAARLRTEAAMLPTPGDVPDHAALLKRARAHLARNRPADALDTLAEIHEARGVKRLLIARAYAMLGQRQDARDHLAAFLTERPGNAAAQALWDQLSA